MSIIRREKSKIGMYHVLMQGAGNNELFHDDEDYQMFVSFLARLMKEAWAEDDEPDRPYFHTYAYCLTPKQFRLIVKEEKYNVSAIMQSISQLYSVVMRYVHQEPLRLGLAGNLDEWAWSSWHEYVGLDSDLPIVCEKPDTCRQLTKEQWQKLLRKPLPEGTKCLEPKEYRAPKPTETQVLSMVRLMTTATNWAEFNAFPKDERLSDRWRS